MRRFFEILVPVAAMLALGACETSSDPSKGGFISGIKNLSDGTYERRVDERQKTLENEQDTNVQQNRALERVNAQGAAVRAEREAAEARYSAVRKDLDDLKAKLAKTEAGNARKKRQVADLNKQIDALAAKVQLVQQDSFTPDADRQKRLEALKRERDALDREVGLLVGE